MISPHRPIPSSPDPFIARSLHRPIPSSPDPLIARSPHRPIPSSPDPFIARSPHRPIPSSPDPIIARSRHRAIPHRSISLIEVPVSRQRMFKDTILHVRLQSGKRYHVYTHPQRSLHNSFCTIHTRFREIQWHPRKMKGLCYTHRMGILEDR